MAKVNRERVLDILKQDNPKGKSAMLYLYCDAFLEYQEANENIIKNGSVVAHPRTSAPIENPYVKIRNGAMQNLLRIMGLKTDRLWLANEGADSGD